MTTVLIGKGLVLGGFDLQKIEVIGGSRYIYTKLGDGFKYFYVHPYLGKIPILTNIFQIGGPTTN